MLSPVFVALRLVASEPVRDVVPALDAVAELLMGAVEGRWAGRSPNAYQSSSLFGQGRALLPVDAAGSVDGPPARAARSVLFRLGFPDRLELPVPVNGGGATVVECGCVCWGGARCAQPDRTPEGFGARTKAVTKRSIVCRTGGGGALRQ